jgi:predicted nuclease with TOPRIM domain
MQTWQVVIVTVLVPALITTGLPYLSSRLKASVEARATDANIGAALRDELRKENEALRVRVDGLEARLSKEVEDGQECREDRKRLHDQMNALQEQVVRLQDQVRRERPGDANGRMHA